MHFLMASIRNIFMCKRLYDKMETVKAGVNMKYYRDTFLEINLDHVFHNVTNLKAGFPPNVRMMAVIKADSYGHGAVMVAKTLLEAGIEHFAVATLDEALELRRAKIHCPILVLGGIRIGDLPLIQKYHITIGVHSAEWLGNALLSYQGKPIDVHLKFDSGMNRLGFISEAEYIQAIDMIRKSSQFKLRGLYSHLASADAQDESYYLMQVERFEHVLNQLDLSDLLIHIGNSAGSFKPKPVHANMVRIGILINGQTPSKSLNLGFELKPSLSLYSHLVQVKTVPPGTKISYNGIYQTTEETIIGTIPIGYADGYDRRLENGRVFIDGEDCPIVGRICMDYCLVKLPRVYPEGTRVELIGEHITIDEYALKIKTSNYHATCQFSDRLPRKYIRRGILVKTTNRRLSTPIGGHL